MDSQKTYRQGNAWGMTRLLALFINMVTLWASLTFSAAAQMVSPRLQPVGASCDVTFSDGSVNCNAEHRPCNLDLDAPYGLPGLATVSRAYDDTTDGMAYATAGVIYWEALLEGAEVERLIIGRRGDARLDFRLGDGQLAVGEGVCRQF